MLHIYRANVTQVIVYNHKETKFSSIQEDPVAKAYDNQIVHHTNLSLNLGKDIMCCKYDHLFILYLWYNGKRSEAGKVAEESKPAC